MDDAAIRRLRRRETIINLAIVVGMMLGSAVAFFVIYKILKP